ncbi:hypothetical protein LGK95_00310 [Clostridium algoriphilum]|uniref:hypothetical protein n=1 Tax=Clostridium algoriphilum TaxID=198347 RepID=UPI001CF20C2E|nr:hypothetical protein [Clostridium algoriphilum]MCB2291980.1 hypothetical protein [Clostridium algoriphilum]
MIKNKNIVWILSILIMFIAILSVKLVFVNNKFITYKNQVVINGNNANSVTASKSHKVSKSFASVDKYGYSDILKCISRIKGFEVNSINMLENEKCNVGINYNGDIKLLYTSLCSLSEESNFINIDKIGISKDSKITNMSINFKKNK